MTDLTQIKIEDICPVINENHNCDIVVSYIGNDDFLQMFSITELSEENIHELFLNKDFIEKYIESCERSKCYRGSVQKLRNLNWNTLSFNDIYEEFEDRLNNNEKLLLETYRM